MKTKIKSLLKTMKKVFQDNLGEAWLMGGLSIVNLTTFKVNSIIGLYMLGSIFILLGIFFIKNPKKER